MRWSNLALVLLLGACERAETRIEMYVDGFQPKNVRFEVEDLGPLDAAAIAELRKRRDVDGVIALPEGSCAGPCRAVLVSVFVHNMDRDAMEEPAPVVRIKSPTDRALREPIAYRGGSIDKGRIGRIRWAVQMWPEERALTATLSSSVQIVPPPPSAPVAGSAP
jgi:hypothetical protein